MSSFDLSDESEYVLSVDSPSPAVDRFKPETVFKLLRKRIDTITRDEPSEAVTRNSRIMQTLLKDPYSVDIRFVFDADKSYSNVGLWAHRSILAEYKPLADLIQEASSESATQTSSGNDAQGVINAEMLTIPLSDISPATLCVLLRYIYTGEINRTVDTSLHAISTTESALVTKGIAGRPASFVRWSPMDKDSPWRLRDVTWEELLRASSRFGVSELQQRCEDAVIASIDASNVVDVLFTVGNTFGKIKDTAMDFIVEKIGSVVLEDKEPFAAYRNHPDAFDFLVELVRRKAPKAAVTDAA
ncbi:hypothetical protein BGZ99_003148 [Dissophora globulifera]|uniref:BTB domain-containing protein n=1 Tax=Dissophora globulifera TaxID=979702 RepID=A0A9P6UWH4_9FUNG|nr:hypothetical protein BGZ99_003148 [Dissophora globulifera]